MSVHTHTLFEFGSNIMLFAWINLLQGNSVEMLDEQQGAEVV